MPLPREEQETIIRIAYDGECIFCTTSPVHMRAMQKKGYKVDILSAIDGDPVSWECHVPTKSFRMPVGPKGRASGMTAERRAAASERAKLNGFRKKAT